MAKQENGRSKRPVSGLLVILIVIIAILLFWISPLKNKLFPSPNIPEVSSPESEQQEIEIIIEADAALSGYMIENTEAETGTILVGDDENNKEIKGFLSFDLSRFREMDNIRITGASLSIASISSEGTPGDLIAINFYKSDFGTEFVQGDFAVSPAPQDLLRGELAEDFTSPWTIKGYSFIRLNQHVKKTIENGSAPLQYVVFMQIPTDNDRMQDTFQFQPDAASISIKYTE